MSTFKEIIARVDEIKPNVFSETTKLNWLTSLNGKLAIDIFMMDIAEVRELPHGADAIGKEPLIGFPHEEVYDEYLAAKIDAANGEASEYQNRMQIYDAYYTNFVSWFKATYDPVQGDPNCHGLCPKLPTYYITAYGIARMKGFTGTIEEWLVSLQGEPGVSPKVTIDPIDGGHRVTFKDAEGITYFDVMNGSGAVSSVCGMMPDQTGNVPLTAEKVGAATSDHKHTAGDVGAAKSDHKHSATDVGALPTEGGDMTGPINMNGQSLSGLNSPTKDNEAATKEYVDQKKTTQRVTLRSSGWVDNCQTVAVSGITADETKTDVIQSPETSSENYTAYLDSNIRIVAQLDGAVTFKCEYVPSIDLTVNVMVMR